MGASGRRARLDSCEMGGYAEKWCLARSTAHRPPLSLGVLCCGIGTLPSRLSTFLWISPKFSDNMIMASSMEEFIKQCFQILEVAPNASIEEVTRAYRDLVKVWHPDRFAHDERLRQKAEEKLKGLNRAYETLSRHLSDVADQTYKYAGPSHGRDMGPHYSPTPNPPTEEKSSQFNRGNSHNLRVKKCPFCTQEIPMEAQFCPSCREWVV